MTEFLAFFQDINQIVALSENWHSFKGNLHKTEKYYHTVNYNIANANN